MPEQSAPKEMGAVVRPDKPVGFRVWAPNAAGVWVVGSFNEWASEATPMQPEGDGLWWAEVATARSGDQYKFRILTHQGQELVRNDPYAREMTHSNGNGVICDPAFDWGPGGYSLPPLNELVLYELHVGTFNEGTFQSAVQRLDHLMRLGVNVIEVMPAAEFAGEFSWGYNPNQIFAVESTYGGPRGFKEFVKQAHARNLGVILDVVYNHFGPSDLDLWRFDGWYENEGGGIYFYNDWRSRTPWGDTRPDYGRPEIQRFLHDNARMWLGEYRVDGLRFDGTLYIRHVETDEGPGCDLPDGWNLIQSLNHRIANEFPRTILIAEDMQNNVYLTRPIEQEGLGFHCQWEAGFVHPVREALIASDDEQRSMAKLATAITSTYSGDSFQRVIYTESHDEVASGHQRVPSEIQPGESDDWYARKRSILGAVLVLSTPGVPMLFQGQEFLSQGWFQDTVPVDWDNRDDYRGVLKLYRDLIRLRRNLTGTSAGLTGANIELLRVDDESKILAFHRWLQGGPRDQVVANFSSQSRAGCRIGFPAAGVWCLRFNSDWRAYGDDFTSEGMQDVKAEAIDWDGRPFSGEMTLPAYTALIFSQEPEDSEDAEG